MELTNAELDLLAEALNFRLQAGFADSLCKIAMEALANKIVNHQEFEV